MSCIQLHNPFSAAIEIVQQIDNLEIVQNIRSAITELFQRVIDLATEFHDQLTTAFCFSRITLDNQLAFTYNTNLLAISALYNVFPDFMSATDDPSIVLGLTSTCRTMCKERWEKIAHNPTILSTLFTKAFIKNARFKDLPVSTVMYRIVAAALTGSEMSAVKNILNLFAKTTYETPIAIVTPETWSYSPVPTDLFQIVAKFPRTHTIHLHDINDNFTSTQFQTLLDSCKHLTDLKASRKEEFSYNPWQITFPKTLKSVDLGYMEHPLVTKESMNQLLKDCQELEEIDFSELAMQLDFTAISTTLKKISFYGAYITDELLSAITTRCSQLVDLDISYCEEITAKGFTKITLPSTLRYIDLASTKVNDDGLNHITASCPELQFLFLSDCDGITQKGVLRASFSKTLQWLWMEQVDVNDMGLKHILGTCVDLEELNLRRCIALTSEAFTGFIPLNLKTLILDQTAIDDDGLHNILKRCSQLVELSLNKCGNITKEGLVEAPYPASMKILALQSNFLDFQTLKAIIEACPELSEIIVDDIIDEDHVKLHAFLEERAGKKALIHT